MKGDLIAALLTSGASGYAGVAAAMMLERDPELEQRFGVDAHARWKDNLEQRLHELSAAMVAEAPAAFGAQVRWSAMAFEARGIGLDDLGLAIECLAETLEENLPPPGIGALDPYLEQARRALAKSLESVDPELDRVGEPDPEVVKYLSLALEGRGDEALALAQAAAKEEGVERVLTGLLRDAQRDIGHLWFLDKASVADEHVVTQITSRVAALLSASSAGPGTTQGTIVVAAVETNAHELGARFVAEFFRMRGWRVIFLGADTPAEAVVAAVESHDADVVALSAMLVTQLNRVASTISALRASGKPTVPIIVGGHAFEEAMEAWELFGADAYAGSPDEAVEQATVLTAS